MSLMELVQRAGNAPASSEVSIEDSQLVSRLSTALRSRISSEKLAQMVAENPLRAENEVRSICQQLFDEGVLEDQGHMGEERQRVLLSRLLDTLFGYGPIQEMLADPTITEIMVNGTYSIYYEREGVLVRSGVTFGSEDEIRALIDKIIGPLGRRVDESSPTVNARLEDGSRVHAIIPPLSLIGPVLTIRKFSEHVIGLGEMEQGGSFDQRLVRFFRWAVRARVNICVSGGTGTGKTTLLNALSCCIPESERIITIEDSAELRFQEHPQVVRLEARPMNAEGTGEVTIRELVINALRMRPDRIVVGECRGAEALDMLQAMNTGHDGSLTTLHANSPEDALLRLMTMVRYAADLPIDVIERQIASALDLGVHVSRDAGGNRYVSQVVEYRFDEEKGKTCVDVLYQRQLAQDEGRWFREAFWLERLEQRHIASREEVAQWRESLHLGESQ